MSIKEVLQISNNLFMTSEDHPRGAWLASHGSTKKSNTHISVNPAQQSASLKQPKFGPDGAEHAFWRAKIVSNVKMFQLKFALLSFLLHKFILIKLP